MVNMLITPPELNHGDKKCWSDRLKGVTFIHACVYSISFAIGHLIEIKIHCAYMNLAILCASASFLSFVHGKYASLQILVNLTCW